MGLKRLHQNLGGEVSKMLASRKVDTATADCINTQTKMLMEEIDYIEKNMGAAVSPERATTSVTLITGTAFTVPTNLIQNGQVVSLAAGENTVVFTTAFLAVPLVGVLSCVGLQEGNWINVNVVIKRTDVTRTQFKVTADAVCTLTYLAVNAN